MNLYGGRTFRHSILSVVQIKLYLANKSLIEIVVLLFRFVKHLPNLKFNEIFSLLFQNWKSACKSFKV